MNIFFIPDKELKKNLFIMKVIADQELKKDFPVLKI